MHFFTLFFTNYTRIIKTISLQRGNVTIVSCQQSNVSCGISASQQERGQRSGVGGERVVYWESSAYLAFAFSICSWNQFLERRAQQPCVRLKVCMWISVWMCFFHMCACAYFVVTAKSLVWNCSNVVLAFSARLVPTSAICWPKLLNFCWTVSSSWASAGGQREWRLHNMEGENKRYQGPFERA